MECIMFVVFVIEILYFCVPYVVCVMWIRVGSVDVGCGCGRGCGSTDDVQCNVCLFELGRRIELTEKQHPFIFIFFWKV